MEFAFLKRFVNFTCDDKSKLEAAFICCFGGPLAGSSAASLPANRVNGLADRGRCPAAVNTNVNVLLIVDRISCVTTQLNCLQRTWAAAQTTLLPQVETASGVEVLICFMSTLTVLQVLM